MSDQDRTKTYAQLLARHGESFANWYHNYSERLFLEASRVLSAGDVAVDAGCYVGDNAMAMAACVGAGGRVLTYEPDPRLRSRMETRLASGLPFADRITLRPVALGSQRGRADFVVINELEGHSGLREKKDYGREVTHDTIHVDLHRLDDEIQAMALQRARLKLIKFDLEGGELDALRGASASISAGRPLIMFEYGNLDAYDQMPVDFVQFFDAHRYTIVDAFGFELRDAEALKTTIGWNLFAVPQESTILRAKIAELVARATSETERKS